MLALQPPREGKRVKNVQNCTKMDSFANNQTNGKNTELENETEIGAKIREKG